MPDAVGNLCYMALSPRPVDPAISIDATIGSIDGFFAMWPTQVIETVHLTMFDKVVLTGRVNTSTVAYHVVAGAASPARVSPD
jgi:hypothetical protein